MLTRLLRAPFDFGVFAEVATQRGLRSVGGLAILILLSVGVATASMSLTAHRVYRQLTPLIDELPTVTIRNGRASANVPQPWVKETQEGLRSVALIIDTTGATTGFKPNQIGLLLTLDRILIKQENGEVRDFDLATVGDRVVGPSELHQIIRHALHWMPWMLAGITLVWFLFAKTATAMLLVMVALMASQGRRRPLSFGGLFAVAVHGLAPAVFLDCALMLMPFSLPMFWVFYTVMAIIYTVVGMQRVPELETAKA